MSIHGGSEHGGKAVNNNSSTSTGVDVARESNAAVPGRFALALLRFADRTTDRLPHDSHVELLTGRELAELAEEWNVSPLVIAAQWTQWASNKVIIISASCGLVNTVTLDELTTVARVIGRGLADLDNPCEPHPTRSRDQHADKAG